MTFVKLWVGDITQGGLGKTRADAIYTDPPWNSGIARIMRQWANADKGSIHFHEFVRVTVTALARACPCGPWYIEVGRRPEIWMSELRLCSRGQLYVIPATWGPRTNPKPMYVICANGAEPLPDGLHGEQTTSNVMDRLESVGSVLDAFVGKGLTLRHALPKGISVFGMEINRKRLAESEAWVTKFYSRVVPSVD